MLKKSWLVVAPAAALLAGCAVGPDFRSPETPAGAAYTALPLPAATVSAAAPGGGAQRFAPGEAISADWWASFRSPALDRLIRRALADSPTLAAAQAALRQAEENLRAQAGIVYFPTLDAKASAERQKISGASFGQAGGGGFSFTLYNASVNVTYLLDLFGGGRRELEGLRAQVGYQQFQLEGSRQTLAANIVTAAVQEASLRDQLRTTGELLKLQEEALQVVKRQFELGGVARSDLLTQQTQLAQLRATVPPLEKTFAQTRHQLAALAGRFPGNADLPEFVLDDLQLPEELPVSLPSVLARQRPDVRAAEELLHAASAQIGVATANLYPQLTLSGSLGTEAPKVQDLFATGTSIWNLGAGVLQPLFHGGELLAKRRAAIAAYDQALAQYRDTVLQAFRDVADVLRALETDAHAVAAQAEAVAAARATFELTRQQFEYGAVPYLTLLTAERQYQEAQLSYVQARASRLADSAALFQALGGGWWNRSENAAATP